MNNKNELHKLKIFREQSFKGGNKPKSKQSVNYKILNKLYKKLRLEFKKRALKKEFDNKKLLPPSNQHIYLALRITGGVGDVVCITRWIAQVKQYFGELIIIDVFFTSPELTHFILQAAGIRGVFSDLIFRRVSPNYDACLIVNQFIMPHWLEFKTAHILTIVPEFISFTDSIKVSLIPYQNYIDNHPALDGLFADAVVSQGLNRKDFLSVISGFKRPSAYLAVQLPEDNFLQTIDLNNTQYITIHDGWDAKFKMTSVRPTKSYPIELFTQAVNLIKQHYPSIKIVQIGGSTGSIISGIDLNLRGKLSLDQSALVLKQAMAHIDTESGLVHLAASLATPCVVIFGSTNFDYYSYQENSNLKPHGCGNCMYVSDTWMETCPLHYTPPQCTQSILPLDILQATQKIIDNRLTNES